MPLSRPEIHKSDAASSLWRKYERSYEYTTQGRTESISSVHDLVRSAESNGLSRIIRVFTRELATDNTLRENLQSRSSHDWVEEWKTMHDLLFKSVFKNRGTFRETGHDVRFGAPGDEDLHNIPLGGGRTLNELHIFARNISQDLMYVDGSNFQDACTFLAKVHYGFIRIHPFGDGNGRIGRAMTDQLALSLGFPPIIAGFPRLDSSKKQKYHDAIRGCIGDPSCRSLMLWIKNQLILKISEIA